MYLSLFFPNLLFFKNNNYWIGEEKQQEIINSVLLTWLCICYTACKTTTSIYIFLLPKVFQLSRGGLGNLSWFLYVPCCLILLWIYCYKASGISVVLGNFCLIPLCCPGSQHGGCFPVFVYNVSKEPARWWYQARNQLM